MLVVAPLVVLREKLPVCKLNKNIQTTLLIVSGKPKSLNMFDTCVFFLLALLRIIGSHARSQLVRTKQEQEGKIRPNRRKAAVFLSALVAAAS